MKKTFVEVLRPPKPLLRCPSASGLQLPKLPIVTEVPATAKPKGHLDPPWCPTNTNKRHRPTFFAVLRFLFQNNFNSKEAVITLTTKKWPDQFFHLVSDARGNDRVATRTGGGTQTQSESKGKPTDGGTENPWSDGGLLLSASNIWTPLSDSRISCGRYRSNRSGSQRTRTHGPMDPQCPQNTKKNIDKLLQGVSNFQHNERTDGGIHGQSE